MPRPGELRPPPGGTTEENNEVGTEATIPQNAEAETEEQTDND